MGTRLPTGTVKSCSEGMLGPLIMAIWQLPPPAEMVPQKLHRRTSAWRATSLSTAIRNSSYSRLLFVSASKRCSAAWASSPVTPRVLSLARRNSASSPVVGRVTGRSSGAPPAAARKPKARSTIQLATCPTCTSRLACPMSHSTPRSSNCASSSPEGTKILMIVWRCSCRAISSSTLPRKPKISSRFCWSESSISRCRPVVPPAMTSCLRPCPGCRPNSRTTFSAKSWTRSLATKPS
mmetsp:Transcript_3093/g.9699  ORF Transcript_3093/g.9699 Transcript_3093/m.9699 type:complete len:237 (+) Transcript_3093:1284-1994(+)